MPLPTKPQTRETIQVSPLQARVMSIGTPGAGKTTLLADWAPKTTLLIDTQHGTDLLPGAHFVEHVDSWKAFCNVVRELTTSRHQFLTVGIDLIDDIWKFADLAYAGQGGVTAYSTNDFQKSLNTAEAMFRDQIGKLLASHMGVWFVSHATEKTVKVRGQGEVTTYTSDLDKKVRGYVLGAAQFAFLLETLGDGGRRTLHTQPSAAFEAKSRCPMPDPMPIDARQLYEAMDRGLNPAKYTPEAIEERKRKREATATAATPPASLAIKDPPVGPATEGAATPATSVAAPSPTELNPDLASVVADLEELLRTDDDLGELRRDAADRMRDLDCWPGQIYDEIKQAGDKAGLRALLGRLPAPTPDSATTRKAA